jgi:hypothetical protein
MTYIQAVAQQLPASLSAVTGEPSGEDAAIMAFATKMADDAGAITREDSTRCAST